MEKLDELLDIKMPPKEPEPEMVITDKEEDEPLAEEEEEEVQEPPREQIPADEIFKDPPKVAKVKRKCSEKQLQHLAKCREKALEKKRKEKEFKDQQKAKQKRYVEQDRREQERQRPPPRKRTQPKRVHYQEPAETYEEEEDFPYEEPQQYQPQEYQEIFHKLSASEIRAIQKDAISDYEVLRKERKHKKRMDEEQRRVEHERRKIMGMMSGKPTPDHHDPWSDAFSF